jgi:hypothetical protein
MIWLPLWRDRNQPTSWFLLRKSLLPRTPASRHLSMNQNPLWMDGRHRSTSTKFGSNSTGDKFSPSLWQKWLY